MEKKKGMWRPNGKKESFRMNFTQLSNYYRWIFLSESEQFISKLGNYVKVGNLSFSPQIFCL